jgi:multidrug efflux pump subunit AcrA (membrane-fusion protein)
VRVASGAARLAALVLAAALGAACGKGQQAEVKVDAPPPVVEVGPENLVPVTEHEIRVGPLVSGELRAALEATVRAEVGGSVLVATIEEGQPCARARCSRASKSARWVTP